MAGNLAVSLKGDLAEEPVTRLVDTFVEATEGLLVSDLVGIAQLSRSEELTLAEMGEGVRSYKLGVTEDPWKKVNREKLSQAGSLIRRRVKGQAQAVTHMLDLVSGRVGVALITLARGGRRSWGR